MILGNRTLITDRANANKIATMNVLLKGLANFISRVMIFFCSLSGIDFVHSD
ncbi:hypothetical protein CU013_0135 [Enterococcus faecium]|nr:hypothetical protein [Enterococcus faecium]MBK4839011.1 hypothetical protein [Enterococcus faecium]MBK4841744.1 hypothetical protein [Enterococcus faecium]